MWRTHSLEGKLTSWPRGPAPFQPDLGLPGVRGSRVSGAPQACCCLKPWRLLTPFPVLLLLICVGLHLLMGLGPWPPRQSGLCSSPNHFPLPALLYCLLTLKESRLCVCSVPLSLFLTVRAMEPAPVRLVGCCVLSTWHVAHSQTRKSDTGAFCGGICPVGGLGLVVPDLLCPLAPATWSAHEACGEARPVRARDDS